MTPTNVPHSVDTPIFITLVDGNHDGKFGFTDPRDTNDDLSLNNMDALPVYGALNVVCSK